jgi:FkbM family methyltransferase
MLRDHVSRLLPARLKRLVRPAVAPVLYGLETGRMARLYRQLVRPGDLVFDVGAAEGYHTRVLRRLGARVVAVEPQRYCRRVLARRFAADPGVVVVAAAVGDEPGSGRLWVPPGDPELASLVPEVHGGWCSRRAEAVAVTTLDDLVAEHGLPAFVKIDVEGYEPRVLAGLHRVVRRLAFEFHSDRRDDLGLCLEILAELGEARYDLSVGRRFRLELGRWVGAAELEAAVAALPSGVTGDVYVRFASRSPNNAS